MMISRFALRLPALAVASLALALPAGGALARSHRGTAPKPVVEKAVLAGDPAKPTLVGSFGDWGAYATQGKSRVCYALGKPKDRSPAALKKEQAYVFISNRPSEGVKNEISVIMGVQLKEAAEARAEVGSATFDLVAKGQNAWVKNAADETRFIDAMKRGGRLIVKGTLIKGGVATDSYSLAGLAQALDRVVKDCR